MRIARGVMSLGSAAAFVCGCAGNYHQTYTAENPDWTNTYPDRGSGLHETLAGLQGPHQFDYRLSISKLAVLELTGTSARELTDEEIDAALTVPPGGASYGVVATIDCLSKIELEMYRGQKIDWLLLEQGRLSAWDIHLFGSRCVVGSEFQPGLADGIALEHQIRTFRDRKFPRSMGHPGEFYQKGLVYLRAGQVENAAEMLAKGDGTFDVGEDGIIRFDAPSTRVRTRTPSQAAFLREQLAYAIAARRSAE